MEAKDVKEAVRKIISDRNPVERLKSIIDAITFYRLGEFGFSHVSVVGYNVKISDIHVKVNKDTIQILWSIVFRIDDAKKTEVYTIDLDIDLERRSMTIKELEEHIDFHLSIQLKQHQAKLLGHAMDQLAYRKKKAIKEQRKTWMHIQRMLRI